MTTYNNAFYQYMKDQKFTAGTRVIKNAWNSLEYANHQLINYLYYKREMKRWRRNIKKVSTLKKRLVEVKNNE